MEGPAEHIERGLTHARSGEYEAALLEFEQAIKLDRQSVAAHYNRGCMYLRLGDTPHATGDFRRAYFIDPACERVRDKLFEVKGERLVVFISVLAGLLLLTLSFLGGGALIQNQTVTPQWIQVIAWVWVVGMLVWSLRFFWGSISVASSARRHRSSGRSSGADV